MTATFRCLLSGQTVTFVHQVDIDSMKGHPDYEPVDTSVDMPVEDEAPKKATKAKKVELVQEAE